jgi:hypothetical protein
MIISLINKIGVLSGFLALPILCQSTSQSKTQLPASMASKTDGLAAMVQRVDALAKAKGFEGWPSVSWNDSSVPEPKVLKSLSPIIRKVWANEQVLWLRVPAKDRWDAVLIARLKSPPKKDDPCRLLLLKDAFGNSTLEAALPKDTWGNGNMLNWSNGPRHLHGQGFHSVQSLADMKQLWELSVQGKERRFTCVLPDSDAGLGLAVHPELGVGYEVDSVANESEGDSMGTNLRPEFFKRARIALKERDDVWFFAPVWRDDPQQFLCLATAHDFNSWLKH